MKPLKQQLTPRKPKPDDSLYTPAYAIGVADTEPIDHPEFGSAEIRIWHNEKQSTTLHLSQSDAQALAAKLNAYLSRKRGGYLA
jgi:hypothetical protein